MEQIIAQLIGGTAGSIGGGKVAKGSDMGNIGNLIAGAVGGVGGGQLLGGLMGSGAAAAGGMDIGAMAGSLVGGGVAGLVVQVVVGMVVKRMRG
ncbi:MAG: hypothetical protein GKR98_09800 [Boseongicola sp.]|nr:MAG: hypothetical protein GKR98_09800 [Boseongicola sp.]